MPSRGLKIIVLRGRMTYVETVVSNERESARQEYVHPKQLIIKIYIKNTR